MGVVTGPEIIESVFGDDAALITDPVSFPWGLDEPLHWRAPVLVDLTSCTDDDLTALVNHLVLTPEDRVVVRTDQRDRVVAELSLPPASLLAELPEDLDALLAPLRPAKLRRALLREVLGWIIERELTMAAGIGDAASRPLEVLDLDGDRWRATLVPPPHLHTTTAPAGDIVIVAAADLGPRSFEALVPGGLLLIVLDEHLSDVMAQVDAHTGPNRLVEHVWGLHSAPGRPTLGGVVGVRPLGAPR